MSRELRSLENDGIKGYDQAATGTLVAKRRRARKDGIDTRRVSQLLYGRDHNLADDDESVREEDIMEDEEEEEEEEEEDPPAAPSGNKRRGSTSSKPSVAKINNAEGEQKSKKKTRGNGQGILGAPLPFPPKQLLLTGGPGDDMVRKIAAAQVLYDQTGEPIFYPDSAMMYVRAPLCDIDFGFKEEEVDLDPWFEGGQIESPEQLKSRWLGLLKAPAEEVDRSNVDYAALDEAYKQSGMTSLPTKKHIDVMRYLLNAKNTDLDTMYKVANIFIKMPDCSKAVWDGLLPEERKLVRTYRPGRADVERSPWFKAPYLWKDAVLLAMHLELDDWLKSDEGDDDDVDSEEEEGEEDNTGFFGKKGGNKRGDSALRCVVCGQLKRVGLLNSWQLVVGCFGQLVCRGCMDEPIPAPTPYQCAIPGCTKWQTKYGKCVSHGGKSIGKPCSVDECPRYVQRNCNGMCKRHYDLAQSK